MKNYQFWMIIVMLGIMTGVLVGIALWMPMLNDLYDVLDKIYYNTM